MRDDYISGTDSGARMFGIKDQSGLSKPHFANLRSGPAFRRRPGRARQSRSFLFGNSGRHRLIQHDTPSPSSIHLLACAQSHPPTRFPHIGIHTAAYLFPSTPIPRSRPMLSPPRAAASAQYVPVLFLPFLCPFCSCSFSYYHPVFQEHLIRHGPCPSFVRR
jgi:hypothetical protein